MKILVMTSMYPPHYLGGAELTCQSHVEGLQERGHKVFVLTSQRGVETPMVDGHVYRLLYYDKTNSDFKRKINFRDPLRLRYRYGQLRRHLSLRKNYNIAMSVVATIQPDVAYVWHMESVSINPILAAQDLGVPVVIRLPDYWLALLKTELCQEPNRLKRWYRSMLNAGFNRLDTRHLLPNSPALMQSYFQAGFPADSMQVIPNGMPSALLLDVTELPPLPSSDQNEDVRLLYAGRLDSMKGPDIAIQAIAYLTRELGFYRVRLDIIGEGPEEYECQLRNIVTLLGLENRVFFLGRIDHSQLLDRYTQYDILLLTSRWAEPFSRTMLEAMARGLPVVATSTGGTVDVISDGSNGLLVPADNPVAMAEAVMKLLSNTELTQRIRCNALTTIRAKYSLERIIVQVEAYLQTRRRASFIAE